MLAYIYRWKAFYLIKLAKNGNNNKIHSNFKFFLSNILSVCYGMIYRFTTLLLVQSEKPNIWIDSFNSTTLLFIRKQRYLSITIAGNKTPLALSFFFCAVRYIINWLYRVRDYAIPVYIFKRYLPIL
jgi:hypothetical protein